jgi:23S rRNA pseudouridine1911/1915/1917 synthase
VKPENDTELRILYEDNHLIAVCKPAGMLTQGDQSGEESLLDAVKHSIAVRFAKPGNVFVGLLHRLDRPVSGVVLFAKTSKAASRLSEQIRSRQVAKIYRARVEGVLDPRAGRLSHFHSHREGERAVRIFSTASENSKIASLCYETRWVDHAGSVLEIELETGRKHQIRAQLAHVGHPIVGDALYGARKRQGAIALCSVRLSFRHPIAKHEVSVVLPPELIPLQLRLPNS